MREDWLSYPAICLTQSVVRSPRGGWEVGGSDDDAHWHCIAFSSMKIHSSVTHPIYHVVPPSITARSSLLRFAPKDSCPLRPRLQDRELHCHHLNLVYILGPFLFLFFFSVRPVPTTPARLPHWGRYAASLILHRLAAGWWGWTTFGAGKGGGDLLLSERPGEGQGLVG